MNRRLPLFPVLLLLVPWFFLCAYAWHLLWTIGGLDLTFPLAILVAVILECLLISRLLAWLSP